MKLQLNLQVRFLIIKYHKTMKINKHLNNRKITKILRNCKTAINLILIQYHHILLIKKEKDMINDRALQIHLLMIIINIKGIITIIIIKIEKIILEMNFIKKGENKMSFTSKE